MGAYAPAPDITPAFIEEIRQTILQPAIDGMAADGSPYVGILYAGLMLTPDGPRALEFNCRFGDPETQVILPLLETDLVDIFTACIDGRLSALDLRWKAGACATVVLASPGYPNSYPKNLPISGLEAAANEADVIVFHAGTGHHDGQVVTTGGRVLAVSGIGADLPAALRHSYAAIEQIQFEGMHYRRDIGQSQV
jgi:phosphoribosylamine--glycine ligase